MPILSSDLYKDFFSSSILKDTTPYCPIVNDSYYMGEQGLAERRFVYLRNESIFDQLPTSGPFIIGEIGFGTGLSFLSTLELWKKKSHQSQSLVFISLEQSPISPLDIKNMLSLWKDELSIEIAQLEERYKMLVPGLNIFPFLNDMVFLIIIVGSAEKSLPLCSFQADHWMLDGFSPSKNPSAWSEDVLHQVGRLSRKGTTLSSFSSAGAVRRSLIASGWLVDRAAGFSFKTHITQAVYTLETTPILEKKSLLHIAGAGIAGTCIGFFRSILGLESTLSSYDSLHASHAPYIYTTPKVHRFFDEMSQMNLQSHFFSGTLYRDLSNYHGLSIKDGYSEKALPDERTHRLLIELAKNPVWKNMVSYCNDTLIYPHAISSHGKSIITLLQDCAHLASSNILSLQECNAVNNTSIDALACSWGAQLWGREFVPSSILRGEMTPDKISKIWSNPTHERHAFNPTASDPNGFVGFRTQIRSHLPLIGKYKGKYLSLHHGSRGFSSGPWCGMLIALSSAGIFEYDFLSHEELQLQQ